MEKKKIGLIGALLMGIGCIVGSGIFGSLPTVANEYGAGVVWALVGAALVVVLRALSMAYTAGCAAGLRCAVYVGCKADPSSVGTVYLFQHTTYANDGFAVWGFVCHVCSATIPQYRDQLYTGSSWPAGGVYRGGVVWQ